MITGIEGRFIVAFDGKEHRLIEDGIVVFERDKIIYVGKSYSGRIDKIIKAKKRLIIPGLINIHCHCGGVYERGWRGDCSSQAMYNSDLFDRAPAFWASQTKSDLSLSTQALFAQTLMSGNTTVVEMDAVDRLGDKEAVDMAGRFGIRAYLLKSYKSGDWYSPEGRNLFFENFDGEKWDEKQGFKELENSMKFIKKYDGSYDDKVRSFLYPDSVVMCSPDLLKETRKIANENDMLIQSHISESSIEFRESIRRYGKSPIEAMKEFGLLGSDFIAGHAILIAGHSKLNYPDPFSTDLRLLAETGSTVAHCPRTFIRYGYCMESYSKYLRSGVNVGIGTDTFPQDILREMRLASLLSKAMEGDPRVATAIDVFNSATLSGAKALHRPDLGRIEKGAKADLVLIKLDTFNMSPIKDPIYNLIQVADKSDVDMVIVDGNIVVEGGEVIGFDKDKLLGGLQKALDAQLERVSENDYKHRTADEINPPSIKKWEL